MSSMAVQPMGADTPVDTQFLPGTSQRMNQNPMLPLHPVTAALDAQYVAAEAVNRATTAKQYADILQQLGYTDDQGNFIPGSASITAQRTADDAKFNEAQAVKNVNDTYHQGNAWYSGQRVADIATAEHPYETTIARLGVDLPVQLASLHEQAAGLIDAYTTQNNKDLADAASRAASAYTANPVDTSSSSAASATGAAGPSGAPFLVNNPSDAGDRAAGVAGLPSAPAPNAAQVVRNTTGLGAPSTGVVPRPAGLPVPTPRNYTAEANSRLAQTAARSL